MRFFLPILLLILLQMQSFAAAVPADSIGMERKEGKIFILHKVEAKETLYSLSRRYNVSIYQIIENNPPVEFGLEIGQIISVPFLKKEAAAVPEIGAAEKIHIIKPKETLYALSQMYKVSMEDIKKWNGLETNLLEIGQRVIIKKPVDEEPAGQANVDSMTAVEGAEIYVVKPGETLYAISKQFDVTISELREWNGISGNEINIGQELIVGMTSNEPVYAGVSATDVPTSPINPAEDRTPGEDLVDTNTIVAEGGKPVTKEDKKTNNGVDRNDVSSTAVEGPTTFEEITESGLAEVIEGAGNSRKYLALHRTATIGTILRVRNEMNDREVFVRVLGRLPDTSVNKNVLIKISKPAYDRLGAIDRKFRVSISYIP